MAGARKGAGLQHGSHPLGIPPEGLKGGVRAKKAEARLREKGTGEDKMRKITKRRGAEEARGRGAETNARKVRRKEKRVTVAAKTGEVNAGGTGERELRRAKGGKRRDEIRIRKGRAKRRKAGKTQETRNNRKRERSGGTRADTSHCSNVRFFIASDTTVRGDPDKRNRDRGRGKERKRRPNRGKSSIQISRRARAEREKKGERVRKDGNRRKGARGKVRKRAGKGHPQSSGFRHKAGADVPSRLRERKRRRANRAGTDDPGASNPEGARDRAIGVEGDRRERKREQIRRGNRKLRGGRVRATQAGGERGVNRQKERRRPRRERRDKISAKARETREENKKRVNRTKMRKGGLRLETAAGGAGKKERGDRRGEAQGALKEGKSEMAERSAKGG